MIPTQPYESYALSARQYVILYIFNKWTPRTSKFPVFLENHYHSKGHVYAKLVACGFRKGVCFNQMLQLTPHKTK